MEVIINKYIYSARLYVSFELEAKNFVMYNSEEEVRDAVLDIMYDEIDYGDIDVDESENSYEGLEELIEEWKSLKNLE